MYNKIQIQLKQNTDNYATVEAKIPIHIKKHSNDTHKIRVGTIVKGKQPSYEGFVPIVVMTRSSKYGAIGPYCYTFIKSIAKSE